MQVGLRITNASKNPIEVQNFALLGLLVRWSVIQGWVVYCKADENLIEVQHF